MERDEKKMRIENFSLPEPSSADLRGRQSVRATFKLTEKAIDALSIVSIHLGIKQKSLFDHLVEDTDSLSLIARELESLEFNRLNRIQKTYVLSRRTLSCLERAARNFETPRDALVEYSIQRLLPVIIKEREKHLKRKKILRELTEYLKIGSQILEKSEEWLGPDDPVYHRFKVAMSSFVSAYHHIDEYVEKGKIIEDFE
jgi:hypothetical protein